MAEESSASPPIFTLGDELLLSIFELLSVPDILSCSLVNSRLRAVSEAVFVPFRLALKRYGLQYIPCNSPLQTDPGRPLYALLDSIYTLNRNWLHLLPTSNQSIRIVEALGDVYFFHDRVVIDRADESDSDDEDLEAEWELEVFKYGDAAAQGEGIILEVEEDGTIVEEIDAEAHGIDVDAIATDEEDDDDEPEQSGSDEDESDEEEEGDIVIMQTEGVHSVATFRTTNSEMSAYKVDISQDLVITAERWLRSKVKKTARRPARGGLNFSRDTRFLRCLTVSDLKPHSSCKSNLGTINIQNLCLDNTGDSSDPVDIHIQGSLVAFSLYQSLSDKIVIVNWRDPLRPWTIPLEKESYMDKHFIADDLLVIFSCPVSDADLIRRSLDDDEDFPILPRGGKLKLSIYYVGPNKIGGNVPCLLRTLMLPLFNDNWRVHVESGKILPQVCDPSSRSAQNGPTITDGLFYRPTEESGVFCITFSGLLLKRPLEEAEEANIEDVGIGWVVDVVMLKSLLLNMARDALQSKDFGKTLVWQDWAGENGENVRVFPHSDQGWLGSPKLYEACSYRVASITPLKRGEPGNEVVPLPEPVVDASTPKKKVVQADHVKEALEWKRRQKELEESESKDLEQGMFGVVPRSIIDGDGAEVTLVDAPNQLDGGPFVETVNSALPYILSRFDLDRGRKPDGTLPLPESVWMTETELILQVSRMLYSPFLSELSLQIEPEDEDEAICPSFDRYTIL
ncbi:hypothetical protein FRC17_000602 [Serendipita sp. 399]|nr:hypothetical protein FRC17_000602 [Serendipita sp. 399]